MGMDHKIGIRNEVNTRFTHLRKQHLLHEAVEKVLNIPKGDDSLNCTTTELSVEQLSKVVIYMQHNIKKHMFSIQYMGLGPTEIEHQQRELEHSINKTIELLMVLHNDCVMFDSYKFVYAVDW